MNVAFNMKRRKARSLPGWRARAIARWPLVSQGRCDFLLIFSILLLIFYWSSPFYERRSTDHRCGLGGRITRHGQTPAVRLQHLPRILSIENVDNITDNILDNTPETRHSVIFNGKWAQPVESSPQFWFPLENIHPWEIACEYRHRPRDKSKRLPLVDNGRLPREVPRRSGVRCQRLSPRAAPAVRRVYLRGCGCATDHGLDRRRWVHQSPPRCDYLGRW